MSTNAGNALARVAIEVLEARYMPYDEDEDEYWRFAGVVVDGRKWVSADELDSNWLLRVDEERITCVWAWDEP